MKIVIVSSAYPLRGGIAHFIGLLFSELKLVNDVNVITFKRQYPSIFFPGKTQTEEGENQNQIPSEVLIDSINPINWVKIGKKLKRDSPDLIIFKYWMPFFAPCFGTILKIAKKNNHTKGLIICDNVFPHEKKPFDTSLTKYFFRSSDYFIVLSESVKRDLLELFPNAKYKLLPHPIYSNFGDAVSKSEAKKYLQLKDERIILFFGFIRDYKGLDVLLNAISYLRDLNIKLIVAGEFYTNKEKYLNLINKNKIEDLVILKSDFIPTSEVKYYFSASDAVILPYRDATQSGIVQIAMNFNKPIIATDVGGLGEVIANDENGYIVEKENPEALANAIRRFYLENKEKIFTQNLSKIANKYSWKYFTQGIMELVKS